MVNRTFGNRYQVIEKIGMGGMAEVYKATDSTLGRTVAIKVMLPQYASDSNFAARFRQEAQAAANLSSPYIVNIYDWGKDGDSYYIVMEYVRGTDLKTAIGQRGSIHPRKVAEIGSQVCSALSVAHGYDIIHRDIKSANIMVQGDGNVKVMDFGIAQAGRPGMTQDSSVLGTAHYVSPEQAQGKKLTPASDLYSLGVVMYEAATGQLPFDGPDVVSVAMKQVSDLPVPPRQINPNIPTQLEAIIMRALEKSPDDRFATAKEMQRALDDYLQGRASAETVVINNGYAAGAASAYGGAGQTTVMPASGQTTVLPGGAGANNGHGITTPPPKQKHTGRNVAIAAIILVLLVAVGYFVASGLGMFGSTVTVPDVVGQTETQARSTLQQARLKVTLKYDISETIEKGKVISQDPGAGANVEAGSTVNLVISTGKTSGEMVAVPNLMGLTAAEAEKALAEANLTGASKQEGSDTVEAGKIFAQDPSAGTEVGVGTTVSYTVSSGKVKTNVQVPDVVGKSESNAVSILTSYGLTIDEIIYENSDTKDTGTVLRQSIPAGQQVSEGKGVTLYVAISNKEEPTPEPEPKPEPKPEPSKPADTSSNTNTDASNNAPSETNDANENDTSSATQPETQPKQ